MDDGRALAHAAVAEACVAPPARIGPNAITQVADVLRRVEGPARGAALFAAAGLSRHWVDPPTHMVDDAEVCALHRVLRAELGVARARQIGREAGLGTGDYLLAHRIPQPAQVVLRWLPPVLAARALLAAIRRHAWTFTGAGSFDAQPGAGHVRWRLTLRGAPLARGAQHHEPLCDFYAATFERLFSELVHPRTRVAEASCEAQGAAACVFELAWPRAAGIRPHR
jgi:divinyl protochlorophyllide a 8-vinyl-reductase